MKFRIPERPVKTATADSIAVAGRLNAVAGRGKLERALYAAPEDQPKTVRIKRLFWSPDELSGWTR